MSRKIEEKLESYLNQDNLDEKQLYTAYSVDLSIQHGHIQGGPQLKAVTTTLKDSVKHETPEEAKKATIKMLEDAIKKVKKLKDKDIVKK